MNPKRRCPLIIGIVAVLAIIAIILLVLGLNGNLTSKSAPEPKLVIHPGYGECQEGWSLHGDHCYKLSVLNHTWANAQSACQAENANLASVHNLTTNNFLKDLSPSTGYIWIGGYQPAGKENWEWIDQSPWAFENWGEDQPNDGNDERIQDCIELYTTKQAGFWNDWDCDWENRFICGKYWI